MKARAPRSVVGADGSIPVLIEPAPGVSMATVRNKLNAVGAAQIADAAPGFVSARLPEASLDELESIARVSIVARKLPFRR